MDHPINALDDCICDYIIYNDGKMLPIGQIYYPIYINSIPYNTQVIDAHN